MSINAEASVHVASGMANVVMILVNKLIGET